MQLQQQCPGKVQNKIIELSVAWGVLYCYVQLFLFFSVRVQVGIVSYKMAYFQMSLDSHVAGQVQFLNLNGTIRAYT